MTAVLRRHVPPYEAQIMAGALCGAGFEARVWDFHAAHLYGALVFRGCRVVVDDEELEEAEFFLQALPEEGEPESDRPPEVCPGDGDPPGFGVLIYTSVWLALFVSVVLTLLTVIFRPHDEPIAYMASAAPRIFLGMLLVSVPNCLIAAFLAGFLLLLIKGYRAGSFLCRMIVRLVLVLLVI